MRETMETIRTAGLILLNSFEEELLLSKSWLQNAIGYNCEAIKMSLFLFQARNDKIKL